MAEKKRKKTSKAKKVARICAIVLLVAGLGGAVYWYLGASRTSAAGSGEVYVLQPVRVGTLSKTVYGSGMIRAANQPAVLAEADGTVVKAAVDVGDEISAGQIIMVLDNPDLDREIHDLEYDLWEMDASIQSAAIGSEVTNVKAPVSGRVMQVNVQQGDDALAKYREHGSVVMLSTDGRMKVDFDVLHSTGLVLGDRCEVVGDGIEITGSITELYMQGTKATVTMPSDQLPLDAEVSIMHEGTVIGKGSLQINKPLAVSAHGGTVDHVQVAVGDMVSRKMTLLTLSDAPASLEMESLRMQRESIANSLETVMQERESLIILAPSDGVVSAVNVAVGDPVHNGDILWTYVQGEEMVLSIAVDELDVVEVSRGQQVAIRVDALPELVLGGAVEKIAPVGTGSGGVSSYDVSLSFSAENTGVMPGMNASGEVEVASVENAIYVPVEALMTVGNQQYVMVSTQQLDANAQTAAQQTTAADQGTAMQRPSGMASGEMPSAETIAAMQAAFAAGNVAGVPGGSQAASIGTSLGTTTEEGTLRAVETGIRNDDYVQIVSGLQAGEVIMYQNTGGSTSASGMSGMMMGGSGGGMMGGMGGMMGR